MNWLFGRRRQENSSAPGKRAWELCAAGDHRAAREEFRRWRDVDPNSAVASFGYAWTNTMVLAEDEADSNRALAASVPLFEECLRLNEARPGLTDNQRATAHWFLGGALEAEGQLDRAKGCFAAAIESAPQFTLAIEARKRLAGCALKQENAPEALKWLEEALTVNPDDAEIKATLVDVRRHVQGIEIIFRKMMPPAIFTAVRVHPDDTLAEIAERVLRDHGQQYTSGAFIYSGDDGLPYHLDSGHREPHLTVRELGMRDRDTLMYEQLIEVPGDEWGVFDIKSAREHAQQGRLALSRRELRKVLDHIRSDYEEGELERADGRLRNVLEWQPDHPDARELAASVRAAIQERNLASGPTDGFMWSVSHGTQCRTNHSPRAPAPPLEAIWEAETDGSRITAPIVAGGYAYVGSWSGEVTCISCQTGDVRWKWETSTHVHHAPVAWQDVVYAADRDHLYCLDAETAQLRWRREFLCPTSPLITENVLWVADAEGLLHCLDRNTGRPVTRLTSGIRELHSTSLNNHQLFAASNTRLIAVDLKSQRVLWHRAGRFDDGVPVYANRNIYISTFDEGIWCVSADSGQLRWVYATDIPVRAAPAAAYGRIYIADSAGRFVCLDAATGEAYWTPREWITHRVSCSTAASVGGPWVYVLMDDGVLYCLEAMTGAEVWRTSTGDATRGVGSLAVTEAIVLSANEDGVLKALGRADAGMGRSRSPVPERPTSTNLGRAHKATEESAGVKFRDFKGATSLSQREHGELLSAYGYMTQDRLDEAIAVLRKLERNHPDEALVLHNLANVYEWRGLTGDALSTFDHILELRPDDLDAFIAVGRLLRTHPDVVIDVFGQPNFTPLNLRNAPRKSPTEIAPDLIDDRPVLICEMEPEIVGICAEAPGWFWWQLFECSTYPILRLYVEFNYQPYKYHELAVVLDIGKSHDRSWLRRVQENESLELWLLGRSKNIGFRRSFSFSPEQSARVGRLLARADAYLRSLSSDVRDFGTATLDVEARRKER